MSMFCGRVGDLLYAWSKREGDKPIVKFHKQILTLSLVIAVLLDATWYAVARGNTFFGEVVAYVVLAWALLLLAYQRATRSASQGFMLMCVLLWTLGMTFIDLNTAVYRHRHWPVMIVQIDVLLLMGAPEGVSRCVVAWVSLYLVMTQTEEWLRYGLFDIPGMVDYEDRTSHCTCPKPPCATKLQSSMGSLFSMLSVFLLDYYITRGFARRLESEKSRVLASVHAAEHVARCLASFDLAAADSYLNSNASDLPFELDRSLRGILQHLRAYKPYLPQSMLLTESHHPPEDTPLHNIVTLQPPTAPFASSRGSSCSSMSGGRPGTPIPQAHGGGGGGTSGSSVCGSSVNSSGMPLAPRGSRSSNASLALCPPAMGAPVGLRKAYTTLLCLGFRPTAQDFRAHVPLHSEFLSLVMTHAAEGKGIVDSFSAEKVGVSFNASRSSPQHPRRAVEAAVRSVESAAERGWQVTAGVASGAALVGVLGSTEMRRHSVAGVLSAVCGGTERACGVLGRQLLCSPKTASDVLHCVSVRLLLHRVVFDDAECGRVCERDRGEKLDEKVYEVMWDGDEVDGMMAEAGCGGSGAAASADERRCEWMYELAQSCTMEWEDYNNVALAYHTLGPEAALVACKELSGEQAAVFRAEVREALTIDYTPTVRQQQQQQPRLVSEAAVVPARRDSQGVAGVG